MGLIAVGLVAFLVLSGGKRVERGRDEPAGAGQVTIAVQAGLCDPAQPDQPSIEVAISPPDAAVVTLTAPDGTEQTIEGGGAALPVPAGDYAWSATPGEGYTVAGEASGSITIPPCQEAPTTEELSAQEEVLLAHVPGAIRGSCQRTPPEEALGRAAASLVCEHEGTTLFYDLFSNTAQMERYYASRVAEFGVTPGSGFCDMAERAENAFVRSRGEQEFQVGRLLCFRDAGNAVFIWTDRRVDVAVEAQRSDPTNRELYRQWARVEFGPLV
ncbi:MAG TPA: hypothetical protein VHH92_01530 [Actinomycetota bacterium]|nr:hypothetical protein [Actinomycetota bacterium]